MRNIKDQKITELLKMIGLSVNLNERKKEKR